MPLLARSEISGAAVKLPYTFSGGVRSRSGESLILPVGFPKLTRFTQALVGMQGARDIAAVAFDGALMAAISCPSPSIVHQKPDVVASGMKPSLLIN